MLKHFIIYSLLLFHLIVADTVIQKYYSNDKCLGSPYMILYTKDVDTLCLNSVGNYYTWACPSGNFQYNSCNSTGCAFCNTAQYQVNCRPHPNGADWISTSCGAVEASGVSGDYYTDSQCANLRLPKQSFLFPNDTSLGCENLLASSIQRRCGTVGNDQGNWTLMAYPQSTTCSGSPDLRVYPTDSCVRVEHEATEVYTRYTCPKSKGYTNLLNVALLFVVILIQIY
jgi:hypothetical protein